MLILARSYLCALAIVLLVVGCGKSPDQIGVDNPEKPVASLKTPNLHKIFVMTTREKADDLPVFYNANRSTEVGLAAVTVSVPPTHVLGELEVPRSLPPDPQTEFTVVDPRIYTTDNAFVRELNEELATRVPSEQNVLFFVHGYNNRTTDAVLRLAQFVEDTGFEGVPILFTWASAGEVLKYVYDLNSALVARSSLPEVFRIAGSTNARTFDIFAHSMGTFLIMESLVQAELIGQLESATRLENVVLASPDIDIDLFKTQIGQIRSSFDNYFVLISEDDAALRASRVLSGGIDRVGSANAEELADLGLTVIDLSEIDDSASGSHSKFAGSPEVVQLLGRGLNSNFLTTGSPSALTQLAIGIPVQIITQ
ncbi:MAG: alpha/beta hydrolase [Pseudomonadota bacterium]